MKNKRLLCVAMCGFGTLCCVPANAALLSVSPVIQTVGIGSDVDVGVEISELGAFVAPSLGAYDVTISYDPGILELLSTTWGDPVLGDQLDLSGFGSIQIINSSVGSVELFELSLDSIDDLNALQNPDFILGILSFQGTGVGASPVNIAINALSDAYGDDLESGWQDGTILVTPTPEVGSAVLVATALCLLMVRQRIRCFRER